MKRILSILAAATLVLSLAACAPDNIVTPVPESDNTAPSTDNDTQTEQNPDDMAPIEDIVTDDTVTDQTPTDDVQTEDTVTEETPTDDNSAVEGTIKETREENTGVKPVYDMDANGTLTAKTDTLKGKTLYMYVTEDGAFTAGDMSEKQWLAKLSDEYGLNVNASTRSKDTLYSAQSIAVKSGMKLDIITADMNDIAASLSLMQSATQFVTPDAILPFSRSIFNKTNGKVFAPAGNTRMLWYNTDIIADDSPYTLTLQDNWTTDVFAATTITVSAKSAKLIDCDNWISFGSAGTETVTGITDGGFTFSLTSEKSIAVFNEFATITAPKAEYAGEDYGWTKGNTAFVYTDRPTKVEFGISFAPIPRYADGKAVAEYTGVGIGIPVNASADSAQTAAVFAALWASRATESRIDELLFDIGLTNEKTEKYLELSENIGLLCNADAEISALFAGDSIPAALYSDAETVYNTFIAGYNRAALIKERY